MECSWNIPWKYPPNSPRIPCPIHIIQTPQENMVDVGVKSWIWDHTTGVFDIRMGKLECHGKWVEYSWNLLRPFGVISSLGGFLAGKSSNLMVDVQFTEFHIWDPGQCTSWFPMGFCVENPLLSRISLRENYRTTPLLEFSWMVKIWIACTHLLRISQNNIETPRMLSSSN